MAARKKSHRYLSDSGGLVSVGDLFEYDEAKIWSTSNRSEANKKYNVSPCTMRKPVWNTFASANRMPVGTKSLPVNILDWLKILKGKYRKHDDDLFDNDDDEEDDNRDEVMAPHEYLSRVRGASFSVQEGVGRMLKGRDLSRVRNVIWKQTGLIED